MKIFHCDHCDQLIFFENVQCVHCERLLAYLPDLEVVGSLDKTAEGLWLSPLERAQGRRYRLCENYTKHNVCNWAIADDETNLLCQSCRLTRVIPDLASPANRESWYKLEAAKRRLVYTLVKLRLPLRDKWDDPKDGLAFEFLSDAAAPAPSHVLTGHARGVITINLAEANDAEREKRRLQLHEPYRTLLGHFRHESGHYYWDHLIPAKDRLEPFRRVFGDETQDYAQALKRHYENGPPFDWQNRFISSYAAAHPCEDWAETWAHYLHMIDTLEIAAACGLSLQPRRRAEPALMAAPNPLADNPKSFDHLLSSWFPLTYVLNNLNRGLGLADGYPFVLSPPVIDKLRFIHETL